MIGMVVVHFAVAADDVLAVCSRVCFCAFVGTRRCLRAFAAVLAGIRSGVVGRSQQCRRAFAAVLAVVKAADSQGGFALVFYCGICK